jgi:hypothetical protein
VKDIKVVKKMYDWKPTGKKKWTTKEMKGKWSKKLFKEDKTDKLVAVRKIERPGMVWCRRQNHM